MAKFPIGSPQAESNPQLTNIKSGSYSLRIGMTNFENAYAYY